MMGPTPSESLIDPETIRRRLQAYGSSGDFHDLWPDVTDRLRHAAHRKIFEVVTSVLNDTPKHRHLAADENDVRALGIAAYASGMGAFLGYWIETETITADRMVCTVLAEHLAHGRHRAEEMARYCIKVVDAFNARGIVPTILKGMYTAQRFFPEPGVRSLADIDFLVTPSQRQPAEEALGSLGFQRINNFSSQSTWSLRSLPRTVRSLALDHAANPWEVDLHTSVDRRLTGGFWVRFGDVPFRCVERWDVGGRRAQVFTQPLLLTHLALHLSATIQRLQLKHLVELVFVIRRGIETGSLRWEDASDLFDHLGVSRFVHPALELAERLVPGVVESAVRARGLSASTHRMRRIIDRQVAAAMALDGRRSLDDFLIWTKGPVQIARAAIHILRAPGSGSRKHVYRRRLRLLLNGKFSFWN